MPDSSNSQSSPGIPQTALAGCQSMQPLPKPFPGFFQTAGSLVRGDPGRPVVLAERVEVHADLLREPDVLPGRGLATLDTSIVRSPSPSDVKFVFAGKSQPSEDRFPEGRLRPRRTRR